jgi:hypothetical protein
MVTLDPTKYEPPEVRTLDVDLICTPQRMNQMQLLGKAMM